MYKDFYYRDPDVVTDHFSSKTTYECTQLHATRNGAICFVCKTAVFTQQLITLLYFLVYDMCFINTAHTIKDGLASADLRLFV